ncbi:MAG: phospholipase [Planctomycetaceae bacterium]|nr:MAG: phospholipase [Planctomycetaceae bacterium]
MVELVLNNEHLSSALGEALSGCRRRLFIATADVKDLHVPMAELASGGRARLRRNSARSIVDVFADLSSRGVEISLLHSGVPSSSFLRQLKAGVPHGLVMRRCPRVHAKAVIADGRSMYLGSANLTGAGLGAKSARRRNFEAGIWTDEIALIDPVMDMLQTIWDGSQCTDCGRKDYCPVPLEEPNL